MQLSCLLSPTCFLWFLSINEPANKHTQDCVVQHEQLRLNLNCVFSSNIATSNLLTKFYSTTVELEFNAAAIFHRTTKDILETLSLTWFSAEAIKERVKRLECNLCPQVEQMCRYLCKLEERYADESEVHSASWHLLCSDDRTSWCERQCKISKTKRQNTAKGNWMREKKEMITLYSCEVRRNGATSPLLSTFFLALCFSPLPLFCLSFESPANSVSVCCMLPWLFLEPDALCYLPVRPTNSGCSECVRYCICGWVFFVHMTKQKMTWVEWDLEILFFHFSYP